MDAGMNINAQVALLAWIPFVLGMFAVMPPRRAVIAAFILAWLFLPMAGYHIGGLPNYDKVTATAYGVLAGIILFDVGRLLQFRPSFVDAPVVIWCVLALASSVVNGLGAYDGASAMFQRAITWGVPYLAGRLYFSDLEGLRELAIGVFIGGLIYVPFCLWEIRMSPRLHNIIYGFHQHTFRQAVRYGGYRPIVFMQHGLAVGLWMSGACLMGIWLWHTKALRHVCNVPMVLLVPGLLGVTILCKSVGALLLLFAGLGLLYASKGLRTAALVALLVCTVPIYVAARAGLGWGGEQLVELAEALDPDRAESLQTRLSNENRLVVRAWEKPLLGWGAGGAYRDLDDGDRVVTDSLWIITFGQGGLASLSTLLLIILLPVCLLLWRTKMKHWHHPRLAAPAALAVLLLIFMLDSLFNAMLNPVYLLAAGGLSSLAAIPARRWATVRQPELRTHPIPDIGPGA